MDSQYSRSRTVTWEDPVPVLSKAAHMAGIEVMRAIATGELPPPPIANLMNFTVTDVQSGRIAFSCTPGEEHYNPLGVIHGGLLCTLLDTVAGCAAHTTLAAGVAYTSIEIKVSYLRPVTLSSGTLSAVGTVTKNGRRVIFADGIVHDGVGRPVASASSSLLVIHPDRGPGE
jgi:uncharacterized protein (TIGR00369 family)